MQKQMCSARDSDRRDITKHDKAEFAENRICLLRVFCLAICPVHRPCAKEMCDLVATMSSLSPIFYS